MPKLYADGGGVSRETVDQAVTKMPPKMVPKVPKMPKMPKTFQGMSGDNVPNGYSSFGANTCQDWVQEYRATLFRNPLLYLD